MADTTIKSIVYMSRKETFSAAHTLENKNLSLEENKVLFGKCNNCHGHNYTVEIVLRGPVDPVSGMVMDLVKLKKHISTVLDRLDHKNLNTDVEYFKDVVSTTENVCIYIFNELDKLINKKDLLYEVRIHETEKNLFYYRGEKDKF